MITVLSVAILYIIGYSAKERKQKEAFYGKWQCGHNRLRFSYNGVCRIQGTFLYLIRYQKKEDQGTYEYQLHMQDRKKHEYTLDIRLKDHNLQLQDDLYERTS